jgi:hypothetical protein
MQVTMLTSAIKKMKKASERNLLTKTLQGKRPFENLARTVLLKGRWDFRPFEKLIIRKFTSIVKLQYMEREKKMKNKSGNMSEAAIQKFYGSQKTTSGMVHR